MHMELATLKSIVLSEYLILDKIKDFIDLKSKGWIVIKQQTIHSTTACRYTHIRILCVISMFIRIRE